MSALSFSGRGDRLAALSPSPPTLRVWALAAGWSLQRGPAVLLPSQACTAQTRSCPAGSPEELSHSSPQYAAASQQLMHWEAFSG